MSRGGVAAVVSLLVLGVVAALALAACSLQPPAHVPATRAQLASVVVLVEQAAEFKEPSLSSDAFGDHAGAYVATWRGRCNAFALERQSGSLYLVTALHCARQPVLGATLHYLPPDGWGVDTSAIVSLDTLRDYAELSVSRPGGLVPFRIGPAPSEGEPVLSVSAFFEE